MGGCFTFLKTLINPANQLSVPLTRKPKNPNSPLPFSFDTRFDKPLIFLAFSPFQPPQKNFSIAQNAHRPRKINILSKYFKNQNFPTKTQKKIICKTTHKASKNNLFSPLPIFHRRIAYCSSFQI